MQFVSYLSIWIIVSNPRPFQHLFSSWLEQNILINFCCNAMVCLKFPSRGGIGRFMNKLQYISLKILNTSLSNRSKNNALSRLLYKIILWAFDISADNSQIFFLNRLYLLPSLLNTKDIFVPILFFMLKLASFLFIHMTYSFINVFMESFINFLVFSCF